MLSDFDDALDGRHSEAQVRFIRRHNIDEEHFRSAVQHLFRTQFVYRDDRGCQEIYDLVVCFKLYFKNLFDAIGYELVIEDDDNLIGLLPMSESGRQQWKLDETILLLLFRLCYQEGIDDRQIDDSGCVALLSEDLLSKYETLTGKTRPTLVRFKEVLTTFKRRGVISFDVFEEKETIITIRPAIAVVLGADFMRYLDAFNDNDPNDLNGQSMQEGENVSA